MSADPWDDLPSGSYWTWNEVGQVLTGQVVAKAIGTDFNGGSCPQLTIRLASGDNVILNCGQAQLKAKVMEIRPQLWDAIKIAYIGEEKADKGMKKLFEVKTKPGIAPPEEEEEPF